jgi:two-component system, NtrC family, sensor kinase
VLLVEDNLEVQEIVGILLEQLGYRVLSAQSATAALQLLASGEAVDLMFTDIIMPGELDGMALARQVKKEYPDIAVLLTTGYAKATNTRDAGFSVLRKPYQISTLASAVRDALDAEPAQLLT